MAMTLLAYHGSTARFTAFNPAAPAVAGSATARLGIFLSADPRIAAHFTLRPWVISDGYAHPAGSRSLLDDPWQFDPDPFLPRAAVATVALAWRHPFPMQASDWARWIERVARQANPAASVAAFRHWCERSGHDGVLVQAHDGQGAVRPSLETDAPTYIAFRPDQVTLERWTDAADAWALSA